MRPERSFWWMAKRWTRSPAVLGADFFDGPERGIFLERKILSPPRRVPASGLQGHRNAITKEYHDRDMEMIKEIGANTIRLAHYQHDQYFYDLCDEAGMIVWAEIPYISEHMPNGRENTISQMKELIIQNYNHPSIVTWGLSNEITISTKTRKTCWTITGRSTIWCTAWMRPGRQCWPATPCAIPLPGSCIFRIW